MDTQSTVTSLLTLLNTASSRPNKRKSPYDQDWFHIAKRAKLQAATTKNTFANASVTSLPDQDNEAPESDAFNQHFGAETSLLELQNAQPLKPAFGMISGLGTCQDVKLGKDLAASNSTRKIEEKNLDSVLSNYRSLLHPHLPHTHHRLLRRKLTTHLTNHILKTQNKILKTNAWLSRPDPKPTREIRDQGFTRPKVLILVPFRNSALEWFSLLSAAATDSGSGPGSGNGGIENWERIESSFNLPEGAIDKLSLEPEKYPSDHVSLMKGNLDDEFRVGLRHKKGGGKRGWKAFTEFYKSDVIVASPLGIRTSVEKNGDSDFLSSIEIVILDQGDVMLMQNWDHIRFTFDLLNKVPKDARDCDFSRVKPWYLDKKSSLLLQSIFISSSPSPELQSIFRSSQNLAGKIQVLHPRTTSTSLIDQVAVKQTWWKFDAKDKDEEIDRRWEWFTTRTLPMLRKSAVSSSKTMIFVPSTFDFIRLDQYAADGLDGFNYVAISEESTNQEISRAREAFFSGKKDFLIVSERFHFFRRYRLRGFKTVVFYSPPRNPHFYPELLSFALDEPGTDPGEVQAHVLFSKWDALSVESIVGGSGERFEMMIKGDGTKFGFMPE